MKTRHPNFKGQEKGRIYQRTKTKIRKEPKEVGRKTEGDRGRDCGVGKKRREGGEEGGRIHTIPWYH